MGIFKIHIRRYREAVANLKKAVKINPSGLEAQYYLGASVFLSGDTAKGQKMMDKVLRGLDTGRQKRLNLKLKKIIHYEPDRKRVLGNITSAGIPGVKTRRRAVQYKQRKTSSVWQRGYLPAERERVFNNKLDEQVTRYKELMRKLDKN